MSAKGRGKPFQMNLLFHPELLICSYVDEKHFTLFDDVYPKTFLKGVFKTRIKNRSVKIGDLPSFLSLYPGLVENMESGSILV